MNDEFLRAVREGFSGPQKSLSPKWLYDERGSELFEEITKTEDYYVTRTEAAVMETVYPELPRLLGEDLAIAEFGSGAGIKSRRLIEAARPSVFISIDVAAEFVERSTEELSRSFPQTECIGVVGDFTSDLELPAPFFAAENRLGFFPGSTIGNFEKGGAKNFLATSRRSLGDGSRFLLGADLVKDDEVLLAAYDDSEGATRDFFMNILERINRELEAGLDTRDFEAVTLWNPAENRVEMGLLSLRDQEAEIANTRFSFADGEMIHLENSHKYTRESMTDIAGAAGWDVERFWTDEKGWFGVFLLKAA